MMKRITAEPETLVRQAALTTADYMRDAVNEIDKTFGDGFAKKNPELVGQFIQTCATDYSAAAVVSAIQDLTEVVDNLRGRD
jgi:hypothetical protein